MRLCKISLLALVFSLGLTLVHLSHDQSSIQHYLNVQNVAHAEVGDQPLIWDNKVAAYAQNYTN